jgi:hypothetical protein
MIDTDKYKGHTPAPWKWFAERPLEVSLIGDLNSCADTKGGSWYILDRSAWGEDPNQDIQLIADAPLLLQEVKRLHSILDKIKDIDINWGIDFNGATITVTHFTGLMLSGKLKLEMIE